MMALSCTIFHQLFEKHCPTICLDDITEINELRPEGSNFMFEVHFKRKNSPWELNVYSEVWHGI